jgi:hypothetical protein
MRRLRIIKTRINKKPGGNLVSADKVLNSDPIKGVGIPSHFTETCEELEYLYDGLQLHFGIERLGKKNGS